MPVPITTTHAKGVGNAGANSAVLDTAGPFARAKETAAANGATTPSDANGSAAPSTFHRESQIVTPPQPTAEYAVETDRLTFKYPGIGGCRGWDPSSLRRRMSTMQSVASSFFSCTEGLTVCAPLTADGRPLPGAPCVVEDMSVQLKPGCRCLLIGPNGA